jgi:hypothetical protein
VNDDNDIARTPEYQRFIRDLAEFHKLRGYPSRSSRAWLLTIRTPFQPEPVVGHRKISLLKLYNRVVELGGYDWVTESKGNQISECRANEVRRVEEDDYSVQSTTILYERWISTQNTLL